MRTEVTRQQAEEWFGEVVRHDLPQIEHEPTRRFLAEVGLPREAAGVWFDPAPGTAATRHLLVLGGYGDRAGGAHHTTTVLLDDVSGRIHTSVRGGDPRPMTVDVSTLVRNAGLVEEISTGRGPVRTAEELFALLAATEPEIDRNDSFWHTSFAMWQLRRAAVPGDGLAVRITPAMLDLVYENDFGGLPEEVLPAALVHEPTRRFLLEIGLIDAWAYLDMRNDRDPLPTLAELIAERTAEWEDEPEAPDDAEHLIVLAYIMEDGDLVVDGRTGLLLRWDYNDAELIPYNTDLSTLAFTMWVVGRARQQTERLDFTVRADAWELIVRAILAPADPVAWADPWGYWPNMVLGAEHGMVP
nr:SUKH-4 family immunity protein [Streptomyces sp. SID3343]